MNCPLYEDLSAYADQMLEPRKREQLDLHLQGCPDCRQQLQNLVALRHSLQSLPAPIPGFDLSTRLAEQLRAESSRRSRRRPFWNGWTGWASWAPAGMAMAALVSGSWLGGLLIEGGAAHQSAAAMVRVFDPVPPGGLCAATELCRLSKGMP